MGCSIWWLQDPLSQGASQRGRAGGVGVGGARATYSDSRWRPPGVLLAAICTRCSTSQGSSGRTMQRRRAPGAARRRSARPEQPDMSPAERGPLALEQQRVQAIGRNLWTWLAYPSLISQSRPPPGYHSTVGIRARAGNQAVCPPAPPTPEPPHAAPPTGSPWLRARAVAFF